MVEIRLLRDYSDIVVRSIEFSFPYYLSGIIIRDTLKTSNSQLVTPISTKLQRPDECD
jgi:hypothetical protein